MNHSKIHYALLLCCIFLLTAVFAVWRLPAPTVPVTADTLALRLAEQEENLQEHRERLAVQLREYYLGRAGEDETARLIEETESSRLLVEQLRAELAELNE